MGQFRYFRLYFFLLFLTLACSGNRYSDVDSQPVHHGVISTYNQYGYIISIPIVFSVPPSYNPKQSWPLMILLPDSNHTASAYHSAWRSLADSIQIVLMAVEDTKHSKDGFGWGAATAHCLAKCMEAVTRVVHIDRHRVYLIAIGSACQTALQVGLDHADWFHGLCLIHGRLVLDKYLTVKSYQSRLSVYLEYADQPNTCYPNAINVAHQLEQAGHRLSMIESPPADSSHPVMPDSTQFLTFIKKSLAE